MTPNIHNCSKRENENELRTISSYYIYFKDSSKSNNNKRYNVDDNQEEVTTTDSSSIPWVPKEWTLESAQRAEKLLQENLQKSDIHLNHNLKMGEYLIQKYEEEASENWDQFYKTHSTKFFKDRHYLHKAFPNEFKPIYDWNEWNNKMNHNHEKKKKIEDLLVVEIGCGVGNTVLPLLERSNELSSNNNKSSCKGSDSAKLVVWGLDFSEVGINLLKNDERYIEAQKDRRANAMVWDITSSPPPSNDIMNKSNISLLLFCLSAISPGEKMIQAAKNVASTLRTGGGMLLFRDYGRYDEAQLKLGTSRGKRLSDNFYVKHDGTRCYYFTLEDLKTLFVQHAKLELVECDYITRTYTNRSSKGSRNRVWVQARFRKP